ncbi:MAG: hypothetical protein J5702_04655 [Bacteroidales bacterium]|nr:hypothetical protein [Bacteroidales bacterium]
MKRILLLMACCAFALSAQAQIQAYTTWPYYYTEFQDGVMILSNGQQKKMPINIHLLKGDLHFIDDKGIIQMAPAGQFAAVQIGNDTFRRVGGYLMKITPGPDEKHFVAVRSIADLSVLNETGGAYGTPATTASTQRITSVDLPGFVNTNHMEQMQRRETGKKLTIKNEYYVVVNGNAIKATKKDFTAAVGPEKAAELKAFLKKNKINWKDEQSLLKLFDFLAE